MPYAACLCGAVRITVDGELPPPDTCHCSICRKISGHVFAATAVPRDRITLDGAEHLRWYRSSDWARRGFCATCGASLFFDMPDHPRLMIAMGAFESPTGRYLAEHINVADKGDYYEIGDSLPRRAH